MREYTVEELIEMVTASNSWDGSLDNLDWKENDEDFFNVYFDNNPAEVARAISFGNYKYNDEYVTFNAYGNLVTITSFEYEELLRDNEEDIIETAKNLNLDGNVELNHLFNNKTE